MALTVKVRNFGRGQWIYLPKAVAKMLDEPEEFYVRVEGGTLVLVPVPKKN